QRQPQVWWHVVDRVQADVLHGVQCGGLTRPAHAGEDHEWRAHRRASTASSSSRRQATIASLRSTMATSPTFANNRPGHSRTGPGSESSATNGAPPTSRCTNRTVLGAAPEVSSTLPCPWSTDHLRPSWITRAAAPATVTSNTGTAGGRLINFQSYV